MGVELAAILGGVISAGLGAASAAGAFTPDTPKPPELADAAKAKRAEALRAARRQGFQATVLGSRAPTEAPTLSQPTVLGIR